MNLHPSTPASLELPPLHSPLFLSLHVENIPRSQHKRLTPRPINLVPAPRRLIDGINPILHLQHDASVLLNRAWSGRIVEQPLRVLQRHAAVLLPAGVHLERHLVRVDGELDPGPGGAQACDGWGARG
jgi:hypothetical protein